MPIRHVDDFVLHAVRDEKEVKDRARDGDGRIAQDIDNGFVKVTGNADQ